jgi:hypothetical protein
MTAGKFALQTRRAGCPRVTVSFALGRDPHGNGGAMTMGVSTPRSE